MKALIKMILIPLNYVHRAFSFKIDNCSYLNLQNKIVSILNESNVTVEDLDNLIQFLTDSKKTATLKF